MLGAPLINDAAVRAIGSGEHLGPSGDPRLGSASGVTITPVHHVTESLRIFALDNESGVNVLPALKIVDNTTSRH